MVQNSIKRLIATVLLVMLFASPSFAIYGDSYYGDGYSNGMLNLSSKTTLTDKNSTITLSLRDSDVKQVLRMFADKAGKNIVFHESVKGKVTLDLVNTSLNEAFDLVLQITNLNYYKKGNTIVIVSKDDDMNAAYSKQDIMIFPVKYVSAGKIADFLNNNVFSMKKNGLSGVDAATVNSATNELIIMGMPGDVEIVKKVIEQFDREPSSRTFAVNHTTPAEMANMICEMLLPSRGSVNSGSSNDSGKASFGSGSSTKSGEITGGAASTSSSEGSDDSGSSLKLGEGIVACTVSSSSSSSSNASIAPFDVQNLSVSYFPQRGTIAIMGGSAAQVAMVEKFIKDNDIKQPQALLEVSIVELNETGSKTFQNIWQVSSQGWLGRFDGESFQASRYGGPGSPVMDATDYTWDGPGGSKEPYQTFDKDGNVTGVTVPQQIERVYKMVMPSTAYVNWTMNYIISNQKGRVLANPKILITNGQESVIDMTQDYVEKVKSEFLSSSAIGSTTTGTVQKEYTIGDDLGIKVTLVPFISPEGYVTLNIKPNYTTIASQVFSNGETAATLLSRRNLDLKNVRIRDGETLILGGLVQEGETKSVSKIPILGDLPVVGAAFRSTGTNKSKSELVIMITPKILNDGDEGTVKAL